MTDFPPDRFDRYRPVSVSSPLLSAFLVLSALATPLLSLGGCSPGTGQGSEGSSAQGSRVHPAQLAKKADVLFLGGTVFDGSGDEPFQADLGVRDGRIVFLGNAEEEGFRAEEEIDVTGLWIVSRNGRPTASV